MGWLLGVGNLSGGVTETITLWIPALGQALPFVFSWAGQITLRAVSGKSTLGEEGEELDWPTQHQILQPLGLVEATGAACQPLGQGGISRSKGLRLGQESSETPWDVPNGSGQLIWLHSDIPKPPIIPEGGVRGGTLLHHA